MFSCKYSIGKELFIHTAALASTYALLVFKFVASYAIGIIMKSGPVETGGQGGHCSPPHFCRSQQENPGPDRDIMKD